MNLSLVLLALSFPLVRAATLTEFSSELAKPASNLKDLVFVSRIYVPYGPAPGSNENVRPLDGYAYGMESTDEIAFDRINHYVYAGSENQGYISVVDYGDVRKPELTSHVIADGKFGSMQVCSKKGWLFVARPEAGTIDMYETVKRETPSQGPTLLKRINVGYYPAHVLPNSNCTLLAVSNEQTSDDDTYSRVTIVRDLEAELPSISIIPLDNVEGDNRWDDAYVLKKGLHMPLTKKALEYWDELSPIANETDFKDVRQKYQSTIFIEGESLAWAGTSESELLINLQNNNGLLRIDVARNRALALAGYGLRDHSVIPVDINSNDKNCNGRTYPNLFSMRNPDTIATIKYNDKLYVLTANEGDRKEFGSFVDEIEARQLFQSGGLGLPRVKAPETVYDPNQPLGGSNIEPFHADCVGDHCVGDVAIAVGSTSIDYELDPSRPTFQRMVMFGGRGWTIYELPEDPDSLLKLVFDSGDDFERLTCEFFPWAYNSILNEEYGPVSGPNSTFYDFIREDDPDVAEAMVANNDPAQNGCADQGDGTPGACPMEKTVDQASAAGGPQVENVQSGVVCGRLVALAATAEQSIAFLYDITNIKQPTLIKIFHLSPASKDRSAALAYNDGTLGDITPRNFFLLDSEDSPSGKPGVLISGVISGTLSFWEFECDDYSNGSLEEKSSAFGWQLALPFILGTTASILTSYLA